MLQHLMASLTFFIKTMDKCEPYLYNRLVSVLPQTIIIKMNVPENYQQEFPVFI